MDLTPLVEMVRDQLAAAADELGDEHPSALTESLSASLKSVARAALLKALLQAAQDLTEEFRPVEGDAGRRDTASSGSADSAGVPVRDIDRRDPDAAMPDASTSRSESSLLPPPPAPPEGDEGAVLRITLRLPEYLRPYVNESARREGLSVNAWLVRAVSAALHTDDPGHRSVRRGGQHVGQRYSGWLQ